MNTEIFQQVFSGSTGAAHWRKARKFAILPLAAFALTVGVSTSEADPGKGLTGSWSGGGWVSFSNGSKEKARCRASYRPAGADSYKLHATCATSSGKASQTATVYKLTAGRYRGSFYNQDYNVRGTIRVVVSGSSQRVSLAGDGASASLSLSRR